MYSFYIWGVRRCAEKENLEWGKQVGNNRENETEIDLLQLAKALWHKAWAIVLVTLITAAMAFAGTKLFITPLYTASAMMYVNNIVQKVQNRKNATAQHKAEHCTEHRIFRKTRRSFLGRHHSVINDAHGTTLYDVCNAVRQQLCNRVRNLLSFFRTRARHRDGKDLRGVHSAGFDHTGKLLVIIRQVRFLNDLLQCAAGLQNNHVGLNKALRCG